MKRLSWLLVCTGLLLGLAMPALADFNAGLKAYKEKEFATALKEWRQPAEQGHPKAQFGLGLLYGSGRGVAQDHEKSAYWFRKSAESGFVLAQNNLALAYLRGRGVKQDDKQAYLWFKKAADQGHRTAQTNLGLMYAKGKGVAQDKVRAYMWYTLAMASGFKVAKENRDEIAKQMTKEQIAEARALAKQFKPKKPK